AQRLSASWIVSLPPAADHMHTRMCSTPFGVVDRFTTRLVVSTTALVWCSTPFGVVDRFTKRLPDPNVMAFKCSTPFGVVDSFASRRHVTARASRLCSTPFGGVDRFTCLSAARGVLAQGVLNAFRRRGSFHGIKRKP